MAQPVQNAQIVEERMTFPPFPTAPPGVTIIPFEDYHENGIRMFPSDGDDTERDGLGIPTMVLSKEHTTDKCKTETSRKRKQPSRAKTSQPPSARIEWYEHWAAGEDLRTSGPYNPLVAPMDRLYEAAIHFRKGRWWPPYNKHLSGHWDQFRLFVGLLSNTPVWNRVDKEKKEEEGPESDDEDAFERESTEVLETNKPPPFKGQTARLRPRPPYALYGKEPAQVNSDAEVKEMIDEETARREEAMFDFLDNPEGKTKIFLSSYLRNQGLIWYDRNLIYIPKLVGFFVNFILRSRVFINEPEIEKGFRKAAQVAALAEKELILTSKVSKELPDKFARCMKECWGQKADGYKVVEGVSHPAYPTRGVTPPPAEMDVDKTDKASDEEPEAKRPKLDSDGPSTTASTTPDIVKKLDEQLLEADIKLLDVNELVKEGQIREAISDNLDGPSTAGVDSTSGWGDASSTGWGGAGWGDTSDGAKPSEAFLASIEAEKAEQIELNEWNTPAVVWDPPEVHALLPLMGPTAFPLTHTSGIVEWSLRRIKSFTPPPEPATIQKSAVSSDPNPDAVEIELERRFAKLVMEPWLGWDKGNDELPHLANPRILETSRGPVTGIVQEDGRVEPDPMVAASAAPASGPKPHDPSQDDITVLVDPVALPAFCEGLGIGATWVQIAREQDLAADDGKKKKKKSKKNTRFWYAEEVLMVIPSFHT